VWIALLVGAAVATALAARGALRRPSTETLVSFSLSAMLLILAVRQVWSGLPALLIILVPVTACGVLWYVARLRA
jgi:hypothetical protein